MDEVYRAAKICAATYISFKECIDNSFSGKQNPDKILQKIETEEFQDEWNHYSAFEKGTNLACAVHDVQKLELLSKAGIKADTLSFSENVKAINKLANNGTDLTISFDGKTDEEVSENVHNAMCTILDSEIIQRLNNIEHIRWARYHWLNNWKLASKKAAFYIRRIW